MSEYGKTKTGRIRTKPNLVHVNVRLPQDVLDLYKQKPNYTTVMREVLVTYAMQQIIAEQQQKTD